MKELKMKLLLACALTLVVGAAPVALGSDTCATAIPIAGLPYSDTGNTCGYTDDYDEACPWIGVGAPDVVYSFSPPSNMTVDI
jgi:hypothetical protein